MQDNSLHRLMATLPQSGRVEWLGLRPHKRAEMLLVNEVMAEIEFGLSGDRYKGRSGKRQVTLVQAEHLPAIASMLGLDCCDPALLRRNIVVSGINLLALKGKQFKLGAAVLAYTGLCHPCSFMESTFGPGGYNAVRGHGGITARVLHSGLIKLHDAVAVCGSN